MPHSALPSTLPNDPLFRRVLEMTASRRELAGRFFPAFGTPDDSQGFTEAEFELLARALLKLQRGLTGGRSLVGSRYMDHPEFLAAYLFFYWPVSYAQVTSALGQARLKPLRVLDAGCGPGPAAAAFLDAGAETVVLADASPDALDLARRVLSPRNTRNPGLRFLRLDLERQNPFKETKEFGPYDCVVFGHSLNELWADTPNRQDRKLSLLKSLEEVLAPGGAVLVVEPALLATSREALALRDGLAAAGWSIRAPCPGRSGLPCPALSAGPGQTCHDELRWEMPGTVRVLAERTGLDKESLKAAWFAASVPAAESPGAAGSRSAYPEDALRVVSDPLLNKAGRVRFLLCGRPGRFPFSAPANAPRSRDSGFLDLRRGDVIRVLSPEIRASGWGLSPETVIERLER